MRFEILLKSSLFDPIGNEDVCIALLRVVSVRAEDEMFSIASEHRESIERLVESYLLESRSVDVDQK